MLYPQNILYKIFLFGKCYCIVLNPLDHSLQLHLTLQQTHSSSAQALALTRGPEMRDSSSMQGMDWMTVSWAIKISRKKGSVETGV